MSDNLSALRKRVKELRGAIVGSVSSAGVEELKKEIAYHESAMKSAEREKKRAEALAKAREAKIAKSKAKKEAEVVPEKKVAVKKEEVVEKKVAPKKKEVVEKVAVAKKIVPKKEKSAPVEEEKVVLSKNIRVKMVKDVSSDDDE